MIDIASLEILLMHYAAGGLGPSEALMVAAHLAVNPRARAKVSAYKAAGAEMVCQEAPASLSDDCLKGVLSRIDAPAAEEKQSHQVNVQQRAQHLDIPVAVFSVLSVACDHDGWAWKKVADGVEIIDVAICERKIGKSEGYMRLMRFTPDTQTARHSHDGVEITLVLNGTYVDETGHYQAGDIVIFGKNRELTHAPKAGAEGCVCLMMTEKPLRFTNPLQRFLNFFHGF